MLYPLSYGDFIPIIPQKSTIAPFVRSWLPIKNIFLATCEMLSMRLRIVVYVSGMHRTVSMLLRHWRTQCLDSHEASSPGMCKGSRACG